DRAPLLRGPPLGLVRTQSRAAHRLVAIAAEAASAAYTPAVRVDVLYFAGAREAAGLSSERLDVPEGTTLASLRTVLEVRHPALSTAWGATRFAVGEAFARPERSLLAGDVVALIPPVSGG